MSGDPVRRLKEKAEMSWTGKIIGAALGAVTGGPIGAALGAFIGHQFDRGVVETGPPPRSVQDAFFATTFRVMGHVAKADGRVTEDEIRAASLHWRHIHRQADNNQQHRHRVNTRMLRAR